MGWFDEQIRQRKRRDDALFASSFHSLSNAILGRRTIPEADAEQSLDAIDEILRYYRAESREVPDEVTSLDEQLEYLLRPCGIMCRHIKLTDGWYKNAAGAILGRFRNGGMAALIPASMGGYTYFDPAAGKRRKVDASTQALFETDALVFYKPLPAGRVGIPGLLRFMAGSLSAGDIFFFIAAALLVSLVGLLTPKLNNFIFSTVIVRGDYALLLSVSVFMASAAISSILLTTVKSLFLERINNKLYVTGHAAMMARTLALPAGFFKDYSAGEIASRAEGIGTMCRKLASIVLSAVITSLFSLIYLFQIAEFAPELAVPAALSLLATAILTAASAYGHTRINKRLMAEQAKERGITYALISGIQKIRLAGAEKRAYAKWSAQYAKEVKLSYHPPLFLRVSDVLAKSVSLITMLVIYFTATKSGISAADYYAFYAAFGMVSGAFLSLSEVASFAAQIHPVLDMARPLLDAEPEVSNDRQVVTRLNGGIELNGVSFRYREDMQYVINDLSLKIRPGQYVAIVGKSGYGKSTLLRMLLGFETPEKGAIYYDGRDISTLDLRSLRRKIGTVTQDGRLFAGDIFSNIAITAPGLTKDEAWEAAEISGIADDIRQMPMGMNTMISEGSGSISGGQRQRLLIARAIAPKPRILMFDEATSALDNITQKKVSDALDTLKCTRIVIAHRLSTIRHCDRIIVLDGGHIIEDGTYDALMAQGGFFAELVSRQQADSKQT